MSSGAFSQTHLITPHFFIWQMAHSSFLQLLLVELPPRLLEKTTTEGESKFWFPCSAGGLLPKPHISSFSPLTKVFQPPVVIRMFKLDLNAVTAK